MHGHSDPLATEDCHWRSRDPLVGAGKSLGSLPSLPPYVPSSTNNDFCLPLSAWCYWSLAIWDQIRAKQRAVGVYGVYGSRREKPQAGGRILGSNTRGDSPRLDDMRVSLAVGSAVVTISSPKYLTAVRVGLAAWEGFHGGAADCSVCVFELIA